MAVLGSAYVVIRAITSSLNGDVRRGLDSAGREADRAGSRHGQQYGERLGESAEEELRRGFATRIADSMTDLIDRRLRERDGNLGKRLASGIISGFTSFLSGSVAFATSLTSITTLVVGLGGAIGALIGAIGALGAGLVAVLGPLSAAAAAIGVVLAGLIGAFLQVAAVGFGVFKQLSGDIETLGPIAQRVRTQFDALKEQFSGLFREIANAEGGPLDALSNTLSIIGGSLFPVLEQGIRQTSDAISSVIGSFNSVLENPLFQADLATVMGNNATSITNLGSGFASLTEALFSVLAAAAPLIDRFTTWFANWASYIADTAQLGQETGRLGGFFDRAGEIAARFFGALKDIGGAIVDVIKFASPLGTVLLKGFELAAEKMHAFTESAEGAKKISAFFAPDGAVATNFRSLGPIVSALGDSLVTLSQNTGISRLAQGITAALPGVTAVLDSAVTALGSFASGLGAAFQSKAGQIGIQALQTGIENFGSAATRLTPALGPLLTIIGNLVTNLSNVLGPAFAAISGVLPSLIGPINQLGQSIGSILLAAVQAIVPILPQLVQAISDVVRAFTPTVIGIIQGIANVIGFFASAASALSPVLSTLAPFIAAAVVGFLAFRAVVGIIVGVTGAMRTFSAVAGLFGASARTAATSTGALTTGAGGLSRVFSAAGGVIPVVGTALTAYTILAQRASQHTQELTAEVTENLNALSDYRASGAATAEGIDQATAAQQRYIAALNNLGDNSFLGLGTDFSQIAADATAANQQYEASLNPLTIAQQAVTDAQTAYQRAVNESGAGSDEARAAIQAYREAQVEAARQQKILNGLTGEGTDAVEEYKQTIADARTTIYDSTNAQLNLSGSQTSAARSVLDLQRAQEDYNNTVAEYGEGSIEAQYAALDLSSAQDNVVSSAAQAAQAVGDAAEANGTFSSEVAAASANTQAQISYLQGLADQTTGPVHDALVGLITDLQSTGRQVAAPRVDLKTDLAESKLTKVTDGILGAGKLVATPKIDADTRGIDDKTKQAQTRLGEISGAIATAGVDLYTDPFEKKAAEVRLKMAELKASIANPTAGLNDQASGKIAVVGASLGNLGRSNANPVAGLNDQASGRIGSVLAQLGNLGRSSATPTVTVFDAATAKLQAIKNEIAGIKDKTVTITTQNLKKGANASGGRIDSDMFSVVGEEGRETVFLSQGSYVATAAQTDRILKAAAIQANASRTPGGAQVIPLVAGDGTRSGPVFPITVNPAPGMNETELAQKTAREFALTYRKKN